MLKYLTNLMIAVVVAMTLYSCEQDEFINDDQQAIRESIFELGYDRNTNIVLDGENVYIGDVIFTLDQLTAIIQDHKENAGNGPKTEQAVVNADQAINPNIGRQVTVDGVQKRLITIAANGFSQTLEDAIQAAVNDYNNFAGISLQFELVDGFFGDITIRNFNLESFGSLGQAQFPFFGQPGRIIFIDEAAIDANENLNFNFRTRLVFHEIGHTVGLRHTDWQTRESCGQDVVEAINVNGIFNQGPRGTGANQVPGTTTGSGDAFQGTSVMNACVSFFEDDDPGRFTFTIDDRTALQFLYPQN